MGENCHILVLCGICIKHEDVAKISRKNCHILET